MVVGVDRALTAQHPPRGLDRPVGDHLIDIHVGLGAGARLPHLEREFTVQGAACHLLGCRHDQGRQLGGQPALGLVHFGAGGLERSEGMHQLQRHGLAEAEIVDRALGLGAPVVLVGNLNGPHAVGFQASHQRLTTSELSSLKLSVELLVPPSGKAMPVARLSEALMASTLTAPCSSKITFPWESNTTTWGTTPRQ